MKTRMKKLISISTIPVLALALLLVLGTVLVDDAVIWAKKPAPSLRCTIEYDFRGADDPPTFDAEGRLLCWEGPISGDIEGVIQYWMPPGTITGQVNHFVARWEIWNATKTELLLAGDSAGTTTIRHGKNSVWRGNGIVTEASAEFEAWIGRNVHDGGHFTWAAPGLPDCGEGIFRIN